MGNELQNLSVLFQNRLFRIPDYQRGYAWQPPQLVDFWEDLMNLQQDKYHYTGLLSLKNLGRKEIKDWGKDLWMLDKGFKPCHVVDGQQRLTTFIILVNEIVAFIREQEENKGKGNHEIVLGYDTLEKISEKYICQRRPPNNQIITYLFGYEEDNPSADYLRYKIFNEPNPGTVNETYYTKNLKTAKLFFSEMLEALYRDKGMDEISRLYQKLTLRFMFNIYEIEDDYDVFVAFETMNNRGKRLTNLELLKNRLIYLTTLYPDDQFDTMEKENLRKEINLAWKEVYYQLGRNEEVPLSDDEFLRAHWIAYFTYSRQKGDDYIKFLLNKFSQKQIFSNPSDPILGHEEIAHYVKSLKDMAKYWYDTFFPAQSSHLDEEGKLWVDRLNRIGMGYFRPLVMAVVSRRDFSNEQRTKIFQAMERLLFICFRIGGFNASLYSSDYYRAARSIYQKEMDAEKLAADINETADDNVEYAVPNFVTKIEKYFSGGHGFYDWSSIEYFLYEYEYSLARKNKIEKVSWEVFTRTEKDKVSIEHILPQTPEKYYWRNQFRQFSEKEIQALSGALGNLLPLSQSINSSLQNDSFQEKKKSSPNRRGYENGSHSEIEVSKEKNWTGRKIYSRSRRLLQFMEQRWEFKFTKEQMDRLTYVKFVMDGRKVPAELPKGV